MLLCLFFSTRFNVFSNSYANEIQALIELFNPEEKREVHFPKCESVLFNVFDNCLLVVFPCY